MSFFQHRPRPQPAPRKRNPRDILQFEQLEDRQLLSINVGGTISTDTVWSDTSDFYRIIDDLTIEPGVTLTIENGVEVRSDSPSHDLLIEGTVFANKVDFVGANNELIVQSGGHLEIKNNSTIDGERIAFLDGSSGVISNSEFILALLDLESGSAFINGNKFNSTKPVEIAPAFASELYNNSFVDGTQILVDGNINTNVNWRTANNLDTYVLKSNMNIEFGGILNVKSGVQIRAGESATEIVVNGTLKLDNAKLIGWNENLTRKLIVNSGGQLDFIQGSSITAFKVLLEEGSTGTLSDSDLKLAIIEYRSNLVSVDNCRFFFTSPIETRPDFVHEFYDNTFVNDATIDLMGDIDVDVTLQAIPNVSRYEVFGDMDIAVNKTLELLPDVQLGTFRRDQINVYGTLKLHQAQIGGDTRLDVYGLIEATESDFAGDSINLFGSSTGFIQESSIRSSGTQLLSDQVAIDDNEFGPYTFGTFSVHTLPSLVPEIYDNEFLQDSRLTVSGDFVSDVIWKPIPNVTEFLIADVLTVPGGITLELDEGLEILIGNEGDRLRVGGNLIATDVHFYGNDQFPVSNINIMVLDGGRFDSHGSLFSGGTVNFRYGSSGTFTCNTLETVLAVHSGAAFVFQNNSVLGGNILTDGSSSHTFDFASNYWGTTDTSVIDERIIDSLDYAGLPTVDYTSFLAKPHTIHDVDATPGDDQITITIGEEYVIEIGGVQYVFDPLCAEQINVFGLGGNDSLVVQGGSTNEIFHVGIDTFQMISTNLTINVSGVSNVDIDGGDGFDQAYMTGSDGADYFEASPDNSTFAGNGFSFLTANVERTKATSTSAAATARLFDSPGSDRFESTPNRADLYGNGFSILTAGFIKVTAMAINGGLDRANFLDSGGDDTYRSLPGIATMVGTGFNNRGEGFDRTYGFANNGGNDRADIFDTVDRDKIVAKSKFVYLTSGEYYSRATSFEKTVVHSSSGDDRADFFGGNTDDKFIGKRFRASMSSNGYFHQVNNVARVFANAVGSNDEAVIFGTDGNEVLIARPNYSLIRGADFYTRVKGFAKVIGKAGKGDDRANLFDSSGKDLFYSRPDFGYMMGNGFHNRAEGFDRLFGFSSDERDTARLIGSSGNDRFTLRPTVSTMNAKTTYVAARGFAKVIANAGLGNDDRVFMYDSNGNDLFFGTGSLAKLSGDSCEHIANDFDRVHAYSYAGGIDKLRPRDDINYKLFDFGSWT